MSRGRHEKPTFLVVPVLEGINAKLHPMPQPMPDPGTEVCPIWRVMKRRQGSFRAFAIKDPFLKRSMKCGEKIIICLNLNSFLASSFCELV